MAGLIMSETQQLTTGNKTWHSDDEVTRKKKSWKGNGENYFFLNFCIIFLRYSYSLKSNWHFFERFILFAQKVIEGRNCLAFLEMIERRLLFI
jgi:hypothetical protein